MFQKLFIVGFISLSVVSTPLAQSLKPSGLPLLTIPKDNPQSKLKARLGEKLFFDTRLSSTGQTSCATCHHPQKAFTDGKNVAEGVNGIRGTRNTPSLLNSAFSTSQFWDGRKISLEEQAVDPLLNSSEHGLLNEDAVLNILRKDKHYPRLFAEAFPEAKININSLSKALAVYIRSLAAGRSAFDRYYYGGEKQALTAEAAHGLKIFTGDGKCASCHQIDLSSASFTDNKFHSIGIGRQRFEKQLGFLVRKAQGIEAKNLSHIVTTDPDVASLGRFLVTHEPKDIGAFKTPSLRNVALTAPYMHDGSIATLEEAVEHEVYYRSISDGRPPNLSLDDKKALVVFLRSLNSENQTARK